MVHIEYMEFSCRIQDMKKYMMHTSDANCPDIYEEMKYYMNERRYSNIDVYE